MPRTQCYKWAKPDTLQLQGYTSGGKMHTAGLYLWRQNAHYVSFFPIESAQHVTLFLWIGSQNDRVF